MRRSPKEMVGGVGLAARDAARRTQAYAMSLNARVPTEVRAEIAASVARIRKVRSIDDATAAMSAEVERLLHVAMPVFIDHPLPLHHPWQARMAAGGSAALGALVEELAEAATLATGGTATAGTVGAAVAAGFAALAMEAYVAASLHVHRLRAAGVIVVPGGVARDVAQAMTGEASDDGGREITKALVKRITRRALTRLGIGAAPVVGVAYATWDAQRTVTAIGQMPLTPQAR